MSTSRQSIHESSSQETTVSPPSSLVFWLLVVLGMAGFAPCILLPEWREYQALHLTEQFERHKLEQLQGELDREQRTLAALQSDPLAVERLARRSLQFHRPGETIVHVPLTSDSSAHVAAVSPLEQRQSLLPEEPFVPVPAAPPVWINRWTARLPVLDYDAVFCDELTRTTIMAMSLGLIALAVVIFRKQPRLI